VAQADLVHPVHPARTKERPQKAGFLTSRIITLIAAFSGKNPQWHNGEAHPRSQLREQCWSGAPRESMPIHRDGQQTSRLSPCGHPLRHQQ